MDDEAKELLREMRDLLARSEARQIASIAEATANFRTWKRTVQYVALPIFLAMALYFAWTVITSHSDRRSVSHPGDPIETY